jgi:hypothetical protein
MMNDDTHSRGYRLVILRQRGAAIAERADQGMDDAVCTDALILAADMADEAGQMAEAFGLGFTARQFTLSATMLRDLAARLPDPSVVPVLPPSAQRPEGGA